MSPADPPRQLAVVTGASRGLGATLARYLAGEGFELVLTARGASALERTAEDIRSGGGVVETVAGDVADPAHRRAIADRVATRRSLRLLVNNASELGPSPLRPLASLPPSELERIYRVNAVAPIGLVQELLPYLGRGGGWVVNVSSDAAVGGYPGWGGYGASKAALDLLSRTLARELAERGITVVSVDPGDLRTAMHQAAFPGEDISDRPLPDITLPFWAWLLHRPPEEINGGRFRAQAERWEVPL